MQGFPVLPKTHDKNKEKYHFKEKNFQVTALGTVSQSGGTMPRTLEVPRIPGRVKRKSLMTVSPVKPAHRSTWRRTAEGGG